MVFTQLKPEIQQALKKAGIITPTQVQEKTIPLILDGRNVVAQSKTGSGKTAAFSIPLLQNLQPKQQVQALILTPTRELCHQVTDVIQTIGRSTNLRITSIYGGVGYDKQIRDLKVADIVVGTPGRILDHIDQGTLKLAHVKYFILDEVDRMVDMGFINDVRKVLDDIPKNVQHLYFSATMSQDVESLSREYMSNPAKITAEIHVDKTLLKQVFYEVHMAEKFSLLVHLIKLHPDDLSIVFCATRRETDIVTQNLKQNDIKAMAIHGGLTQNKRLHALEMLKKERVSVLVATDVAARGLDIRNVEYVYNYDVPKTGEEYTHRIGRTARAGSSGIAYTILTRRDHDNFDAVLRDRSIKIEAGELPEFAKVPFVRQAPREREGGRREFRSHDRSQKSYGRRDDDAPRSGGFRSSNRPSSEGGERRGFGGPRRFGSRDGDSRSGGSRFGGSRFGGRGGDSSSRPPRRGGSGGGERRGFSGGNKHQFQE